MNNVSNFSERLKDLLLDNQKSPEQLAEEIKTSRSTVYRWLQKNIQISLSKLIAIADYFRCSLDYLGGRADESHEFVPKTIPNFGTQLRKVLKNRGFTTYSLRETSRYDSKYFQNWDSGIEPNLATLIELSTILDCTIDYLVGRE